MRSVTGVSKMANDNAVYWISPLGPRDDFGGQYRDIMYDGRTIYGYWANMNEHNWQDLGSGKLGTGYGQKYKKQADGRWLKVEG
jgi:hypothetical protein